MTPHGDCWVWDGYLGECKQWHPAQWWQYMNAYSMSLVIVVAALAVIAIIFAVSRAGLFDE